MKITAVNAIYPRCRAPLGAWRPHLWQIAVRIESDAGVVGLGCGGGGEAAVTIIQRHLRELLVGRTIEQVDDIAAIWDNLYRATLPYGRRGLAIMALSGIDLALWDLLARARGVPVYELLGGLQTTRVRAYATGSDVEWFAEQGFTAHKRSHRWTGREQDYNEAVDAMARARELLGPNGLIMLDCYMTWDADVTRNMATRLRDHNVYWFEDVLTPDRLHEQATLREPIKPVRLAGGEHEFTHHGFAEIARAGALDIWQPDITWCGGMTAALRILDLAREHDVRVVFHRGGEPWGLHLIAAADQASACDPLAELVLRDRHTPSDCWWLDAPEAIDGCLTPGDAPGFGVRLDETLI